MVIISPLSQERRKGSLIDDSLDNGGHAGNNYDPMKQDNGKSLGLK